MIGYLLALYLLSGGAVASPAATTLPVEASGHLGNLIEANVDLVEEEGRMDSNDYVSWLQSYFTMD